MYKLIHYRDKCIGCGICYEQQPEYWRMSRKDGKATLVKAAATKNIYILEVNISSKQRSMETAKACPVNIIKVS
jgi:ferredoxin